VKKLASIIDQRQGRLLGKMLASESQAFWLFRKLFPRKQEGANMAV
jgi:hypothetical protein